MIQVAVIGDGDAAFYAAKKGFVVLGVEPELGKHVRKAGGVFVLFGKKKDSLTVSYDNIVDAISKMIESSDLLIVDGGSLSEFAKKIAEIKHKSFVEGKGQDVVEEAAEKLVRFNLFGKKN